MSDEDAMSWAQATSLAGKTVIVTGCASGIGRETARQFAFAGARVYGGDINEVGGEAAMAQIRAAGAQGNFIALDLAEGASIDRFVEAVGAQTQGAIDIIASVAGWDRAEPFLDNTPEFWDQVIAINYVGPVRMIHRLLPFMIRRGVGGKIITVASDAGRVGSLGETFYSGSKGAIIAFTKGLAREMAREQIRCNCIAPGPTDTPLFHAGVSNPKLKESLIRAIPLKRLAQPAEIAHAILYFACAASDYVTGQVLSVSGGLTMSG
jgi:2-hydroxycyclohexanecarboxyl-CoA dehydrogenase